MTPTCIRAVTSLRVLIVGLTLALGGCFGLNRGAPAPEYYLLDGVGTAAATERPAPAHPEAPLVGLRPLRIADYLNSPLIVVRSGTHRVEFSEFHRWGEELSRGVARTLARRMAARSPGHRVESAPWPPSVVPEYRIQVDVVHFEGIAPSEPTALVGEAHLMATWSILGPATEAVLASGTTDVRSSGWMVGDFAGLVALLDRGLDTLVNDLGLALDRLSASPATPRIPR